MTDHPVPVPQASLPVRLVHAASQAFPHHTFEAFEDEPIELYCVVSIVTEDPADGEMTVKAAAVADTEALPGDELLFQLARMNGEVLEVVDIQDELLDALDLTRDGIARFVADFNAGSQ